MTKKEFLILLLFHCFYLPSYGASSSVDARIFGDMFFQREKSLDEWKENYNELKEDSHEVIELFMKVTFSYSLLRYRQYFCELFRKGSPESISNDLRGLEHNIFNLYQNFVAKNPNLSWMLTDIFVFYDPVPCYSSFKDICRSFVVSCFYKDIYPPGAAIRSYAKTEKSDRA